MESPQPSSPAGPPRSWLYLDGTNSKKLGLAPQLRAAALVIDLAPITQDVGEAELNTIAEWLSQHAQGNQPAKFARWIRIKPLNKHRWRDELAVVMRGKPDGVILPQAETPEQVRMLASELYEMESRNGLTINTTQIMLEAGASAVGAVRMGEFLNDPQPRLAGLIWNGHALAQSLGASATQGNNGTATDTLRFTRIQVLLTARALGLMAVDAPFEDVGDVPGGLAAAIAARRDGFTGMAANHPRQINPIHHAFASGSIATSRQ